MNSRIILVGPGAGGKDFLKKKFSDRGFKLDVSYTTRSPRQGEQHGVDYQFINESEFTLRISQDGFYEHVKYGGSRYGTGKYEWDNCDVFIMETDGIAEIKPEDRKNCFIIYLDPPEHVRIQRMRIARKWDYDKIRERLDQDKEKFAGFKDFDMKIIDPEF